MARSDVRGRMVGGAAQLLSERGLEGTSFAEVLALVDAPRGSTYHHFPGGKDELVGAAMEAASRRALAYLEPASGRSAVSVVERFLAMWGELLDQSGLTRGCAVLAVTVATDSGDLLDRAGQIFRDWTDHLDTLLQKGGLPPASARTMAVLTIASAEGAVVLSRAQRSREPFDLMSQGLLRTIRAERRRNG